LPAEIVVLVEVHLADCPHCREYLSQMRLTIAKTRALTGADVDSMPAEVRDRLMEAFREHHD
jgi:predicted anti-sigma-YlaC factor YlaD